MGNLRFVVVIVVATDAIPCGSVSQNRGDAILREWGRADNCRGPYRTATGVGSGMGSSRVMSPASYRLSTLAERAADQIAGSFVTSRCARELVMSSARSSLFRS